MSVLLQDVLVTGIAASAFVTLVWRTVGLLRPSSEDGACTACPSCEVGRQTPDSAATVVPLSSVRRRHSVRSDGGTHQAHGAHEAHKEEPQKNINMS